MNIPILDWCKTYIIREDLTKVWEHLGVVSNGDLLYLDEQNMNKIYDKLKPVGRGKLQAAVAHLKKEKAAQLTEQIAQMKAGGKDTPATADNPTGSLQGSLPVDSSDTKNAKINKFYTTGEDTGEATSGANGAATGATAATASACANPIATIKVAPLSATFLIPCSI